MINLDEEVQYEWNKGLDQLPQTYHHKFTVSLEDLLQHNCTSKINWLFSIWAARETKDPTYLSTQIHRHSQPALKFKYVAWKTRISTWNTIHIYIIYIITSLHVYTISPNLNTIMVERLSTSGTMQIFQNRWRKSL